MLRVVGDVYIVRILVDGERWQHMVHVTHDWIYDDGIGPGLAAIAGAYEQNVGTAGRVTVDLAGRIGPGEIEDSVAGRESWLQGHAGRFYISR